MSNEKKLVERIMQGVNDFSLNADMFAEEVIFSHRTLQQGFVRVMVKVLEKMAREFECGRYDGRCKAAYEFASEVMKLDELKRIFPYI